jgi:hypothetical protein
VAIDTGRFVDNNNDHGLSPDGKLLVISDQIEPDNLSRIHVVTLDGSAPVRTLVDDPQARSYWHGWSPDGATLAYVRVGASDGSYDIWAQDLAGGAPRPLVVGPGVDDGPEYAPDGRYLYFNSTRSGAMALWRASADGSDPVMLTHDPARRDWFAHLFARRKADRLRLVRRRRRARGPPAQPQRRAAADHAGRRQRPADSAHAAVRRPGHDQRPELVARRPQVAFVSYRLQAVTGRALKNHAFSAACVQPLFSPPGLWHVLSMAASARARGA